MPRDNIRKKVLLVFGSLERAGAQLRTLEVCRELRQRYQIHFDFCILDLGPIELHSDAEALGASIHVIPLRSPRFVLQLSRLLRRERYDVVYSTPKLISGLVVWLAERNDVPVRIAAFRNTIGDSGELTSRSRLGRRVLPNRLFVALMRGLVKRYATHVVAVSRDALDTMFPSGSQTRPRCQVIYNGVHLARFQGPVEAHAVREEFGWPPDSRIVVNVARLSPQKNHRTMLEAIRIVHERDDRVRLLLVGSGRLRDEVSQQIDDLGMWRICALTSDRTDVPRLLLASDVFFFPSLWEGLPGAPLEALAAGLPVVASDIRPIQEIAEYFPGSVFMSPADAAPEHAEKIHAALSSRSDRGGAQARFASTPFVFEKSVSAHAALYGLANGTP